MFDSMPKQMGLTLVVVVVGAILVLAGVMLAVRFLGTRERDSD
jgi:hypothetical protein